MRKNFSTILIVGAALLLASCVQQKESFSPVDYVNPLMGTESTYAFSHGNTYPAVAVPWGMNFWSPQTGENGSGWMYTYTDSLIRGFRQTHQPSPWINDYGTFSIMPLSGVLKMDHKERGVPFSHIQEEAAPYSYSVTFANGLRTELSATSRGAVFEVTFPQDSAQYIVVDAYNGGSWRISSEAFFEPAKKIVDELKIRASYGSLGNQSVGGDYPYIATMGTNGEMGYLVDGKKIASVSPGGIVSPYLTWETVRQIDLGLDWALLNSRLYGTFDWYMRKTLDMVTNGTPLPAVLGTGAPQANTADLKTTGWELSMGWRDRVNKDFSYDVSFVLSDYQAEITKFNNPQNLLSTHYVGKKWGEIWGLVTEGLFQSAEEVSAHADQSEIYGGGWYPGDVKYKDLNGDGKINKGKNTLDDPGDQKIIGNSEPRYSYGIKGGLQWRDFDFDVFFQGIGKKDVVLGGNQFWGFGNEWHVPFKHALDSWTEDNRNAYFPRSTYDNVTGNRETQTRYLQNAAYLRLKSITLGYSLPKALLAKWKIDHVRFYVSGQNLLTFDHLFDIYDPETVSLSTYPLTKSVSFGLNITL